MIIKRLSVPVKVKDCGTKDGFSLEINAKFKIGINARTLKWLFIGGDSRKFTIDIKKKSLPDVLAGQIRVQVAKTTMENIDTVKFSIGGILVKYFLKAHTDKLINLKMIKVESFQFGGDVAQKLKEVRKSRNASIDELLGNL